MTQEPSPSNDRKTKRKSATYALKRAADAELLTSSSLRMLQGTAVTLAGLEGGIFCLISRAAASSLSAFLLEITTLQPEDQQVSHEKQLQHFPK